MKILQPLRSFALGCGIALGTAHANASVVTYDFLVTINIGTIEDLYFKQFESLIPDPIQRGNFVNALLSQSGIDPDTEVSSGSIGKFAFDDQLTVLSGIRNEDALLSNLSFTFGLTNYVKANVTTELLGWDNLGNLSTFKFGTYCPSGSCQVRPGFSDWLIDTDNFFYSTREATEGVIEEKQSVTFWQHINEIPEPGSLALIGAGFFGMAFTRRQIQLGFKAGRR